MIEVDGVTATHFPADEFGNYAGHYPANDQEALAQLRQLISSGIQYLVIPATCSWWPEFYPSLQTHLNSYSTHFGDNGLKVYSIPEVSK